MIYASIAVNNSREYYEELNATTKQRGMCMLKNKPEKYGISSANLLYMVHELETFVEDIHSISVVCDNDIIFSKCIPPYTEESLQMLHSFSKSMNSIAVGIAISEGKLKLDDLVVDHFREYLPETYDRRIDRLTVRNLLTMAANSCRLSTCFRGVTSSWITHYFTYELPHDPGTVFQYDTGASYMLSSLVSKTMHKNVLELMKERVFRPMGITDVEWLESPEGNTVGGWGLYLKTPDITKIAILLANMGNWNGKQLIPEEYLKEATRKQIDTPEEKYPVCGYGYQYWITADHSFGVYGAFGNVIVVNPEKKMAVAITAGASDKHGNPNRLISKIVNEKLFVPTTRKMLSENAEADGKLENYVDDLILPFPAGKETSPLEDAWFGKTIVFQKNEHEISEMNITRTAEKEIRILFRMGEKEVEVHAGYEKWITQNAVFDDPRHFMNSFAYAFADDNTLIWKQYWLNMSGYDTYMLHYQGDVVNGMIITSVKLGGTVPVELAGRVQ